MLISGIGSLTHFAKSDLIPPEADPCIYRSKLDDLTLLGIFVADDFICTDIPAKLAVEWQEPWSLWVLN